MLDENGIPKAYAIWIFIILAVLAGIGIAASEYLDAATSLLPGGEDGGER